MTGATTGAIILAAGASSRLGEAKQLVRLCGETMLDRAIRVTEAAALSPIVVVLGAGAKQISETCDLRRAWVVVNTGWAEGMGSSVRSGAELAQGFALMTGAVVMTCDMPGVTAAHLRRLVEEPERVTASRYGGRAGVPAYFPRSGFPDLLALEGDAGARALLRAAATIELEGGEMDVDTAADLERASAVFDGAE